ncbi:unnamed protein product [Fusarium graminearum]|nr:unnamed protein product [Fusarium graminearum]
MCGNVCVRRRGITASYTRPPNRPSPYETGRQTSLPLLQDSDRIDPHKQNTLNDALDHLRSAHAEKEDPMDCPISGYCITICRANGNLKNHVEHNRRVNAHKGPHCGLVLRSAGVKHKCPRCTQTFTTLRGVEQHVKRIHEGEKFPCPFQDCDVQCSTCSSPSRYIKRKHKNEFLLCPKDSCVEGFKTLAAMKKHVETGHSNQFPCADEKCTKLFETQQKVDDKNLDCRFCGQNFSGTHLETPRRVTYS